MIMMGRKRRRKINVSRRGKIKVVDGGRNGKSGAREGKADERAKRWLREKGKVNKKVNYG
jgi:hypothetical protein